MGSTLMSFSSCAAAMPVTTRFCSVPAAIVWIASPEGEFAERQPAWEEYTGQTWEEYQYSKWISVIHPEDRAQVMAD